MILRPLSKAFKPPSTSDAACILLVAVFVPLTYIFHVTVVMPELHVVGGFWYTLVWLAALFVLFNITSNLLACMLVDTTIKKEILKPPLEPELLRQWHMCDACQALVPPRTWHCDVCDVCIIKRDHHCRFSGCCIGHHNYRYFFYFLVYMCIGAGFVVINASIYLWYLHADYYWRPYTVIALFVPALSFTLFASWENFYLFLYELNILAFGISLLMLIYHFPIFKRGAVMKQRNSTKHDLGLRANAEMVLGKRMHLTWLSPFLRSDLPHDGINWIPGSKAE
ncbi:probable palmitoyltransferase ZDHHC24 [Drosophila sulfurigaster albostrigata]|uniref:probable palmitoyltransferase ZDHHC24 n=1 Tax=Drosophila sulfurigaster albostrigata TaxID=89887 RepID=UPI002D21A152|nr:probable palmitoyltransferase ZDHHC24 [Drosophila sulfurigaster albostrigata]